MKSKSACILLLLFCLVSCKITNLQNRVNPSNQLSNQSSLNDSFVYKTDLLHIQRLSNHVFVHTSFLQTQDFGKVDCNGMIIINENEAIVFDTPANPESSAELIAFIKQEFKSRINAIIPTHFHEDCVGGLETFFAAGIPAYAFQKTIDFLKVKNREFSKPLTGFEDSLTLQVGNKLVYTGYYGEGHTKDNIIGYFPAEEAIFGGCLIKSINASKGNLEDANIKDWSATVKKIKQKIPHALIVIPGHGKWGSVALLDYTIKLFE